MLIDIINHQLHAPLLPCCHLMLPAQPRYGLPELICRHDGHSIPDEEKGYFNPNVSRNGTNPMEISDRCLCNCAKPTWNDDDIRIAKQQTKEWALPRKWNQNDHIKYWPLPFRDVVRTLLCDHFRPLLLSLPTSVHHQRQYDNGGGKWNILQKLPKILLLYIIEMASTIVFPFDDPSHLTSLWSVDHEAQSIHERQLLGESFRTKLLTAVLPPKD
jgi:hypothetical protein